MDESLKPEILELLEPSASFMGSGNESRAKDKQIKSDFKVVWDQAQ